jgi:hypothetical protein
MTAFCVTVTPVSADDLASLVALLLEAGWDADVELASTPSGGGDDVAAVSPPTDNLWDNACPKCGAAAGTWCTTPSGQPYGVSFWHAGRG